MSGMTVLHRDLQRGHKYSPFSRSMISSAWSRFLVVFWTASKYLEHTEKCSIHITIIHFPDAFYLRQERE